VILGIETATSICSAGIADGERVAAEIRFNIPNIHAEVLAESIEHLLRLSGTSLRRIEAIAVSIGPGSFTGLRIGLATAKGLAFASGKPLVTVSTLLAQAAASGRGQRAEGRGRDTIIPVIKARQDEIYAASFRSEWPMPIAESDEVLLPIAEFPQWLQTPAVLCGNGVAMLQARGVLNNLRDVIVVPEAAAMLGGGLIARFGAIKLAAGEISDLENLEPRYLQAFETGPRNKSNLAD
jgi:tRNA threonylcarbamoyladenosine biosynthesis protein TsaB